MAIKSQGSFLKRAGVEVAEISSFSGPDGEASEIDVTHLRSTAKEYLQGLGDEGNITLSGFLKASDAAQVGLRTDRDAQTSSAYSLTLSDGTVLTFTAFCKQFGISNAVDGATILNVTLRITGIVTWS